VINATGLGARTLLGVEDSLVHPVRGQTVLVKAPHVRKNINHKDAHERPEEKCYIIPRPGPEGHVILGGVQQAGRWDTQPEPDTARRIIERALKACPELSRDGTVEGVEIVSHNVGLRPSREGGIRLELEERVIGKGVDGRLLPHGAKGGRGRRVAVVHAYGIGPAG
jgi:glycine/D-amino acid oxidase-like deaminating enzyme